MRQAPFLHGFQAAAPPPKGFAPKGLNLHPLSRIFRSQMNYTELNEVLSTSCQARRIRRILIGATRASTQDERKAKLRIALKYGLLITLGVITWVVIAHLLVPNPRSPVHMIGPLVFFNLLEIAGIYFGMGARKRDDAGQLQFKTALKTGVAVAFVYAFGSCLFFLIYIAVLGPQGMGAEPGAATLPFWQVAALAFAMQFGGAVFFGLIYSTIIAFLLATRRGVS